MPDTLRSQTDCELEDSPGFTRETHYKNIVHLWEFLLELLANENCRSIITWTSKDRWEFKVQNPQELAKKWGMFKKKNVMTYENLSRSLRYYYKQGIIKKAPNKNLVYRFHKLPYKYEPGVTRSRHHGNRINACIEQEERNVTRSRHVHGINVCTEQKESGVTTSHPHRNTRCSEQQEPGSSMSRKKENWMDACPSQRKAHSAPPMTISIESTTRSAFTPVTTPVGRRQSVPLISTPLRPLPWYPDPTPLAPLLSTAQSRIIAPVTVETMTFGIEPYVPVSQPVEQVPPIVHVATTKPSSIRVSVIKRTQPF